MRDYLADSPGTTCDCPETLPNNHPRLNLGLHGCTAIHVGSTELQQLFDTVDAIMCGYHNKVQRCIQTWAAELSVVHPDNASTVLVPLTATQERAAKVPVEVEQSVLTQPTLREAWPTKSPSAPIIVNEEAVKPPNSPPPTTTMQGSQYCSSWTEGSLPNKRTRSGGWRDMVHSDIVKSKKKSASIYSNTNKHMSKSRLLKDNMNANDYLTEKAQREAMEVQSELARFTGSKFFEWTSMTLIILNAIFIGVQTCYMTNHIEQADNMREDHIDVIFFIIQILFCIGFCLEVALRWRSDGLLRFFRTKDRGWNIYDTVIVSFSLVEIVVKLMAGALNARVMDQNVVVLRLLRILRLVRIIRIIRVVKFFRDLRIMIYTIINSVKSLFWVVCVICGLLYIFGISLTDGVYDYLSIDARWQEPANVELRNSFGTLDRSLLTLYMAIIGGKDWGDYLELLAPLPMVYKIQYVLYITFTVFAVMNVVTGVFVDSAFEFRRVDRDIIIQEALHAQDNFRQNIKELFNEIDTDDSGAIALEEFEEVINEPRAIAFFEALELDFHEAKLLFHLLDADRSGSVSTEEFLNGCQKLKGGARTVDLTVMHREIQWLLEIFLGFADFVEDKLTTSKTAEESYLH